MVFPQYMEGRMAVEQNLLREDEAAAVVGFTVQTLRKRRYLRKPPQFLKVGRNVRYRLEDLRAFLDECVVPVLIPALPLKKRRLWRRS